MKKFVWLLLGFFVIASSSVYLSGCHRSDGNNVFFGAGGTSTTGQVSTFSSGPITAIGTNSITVNGVSFSTSNAHITVNGRPGVASDLKVGQVVTVKGRVSGTKGTASQIVFSSDLLGPVTSIATGTTGTTVTVLGQTVRIDNKTALSSFGTGTSSDIASLATGSIIDVSGLPDSAGILHATFVSKPTASVLEFSVRGLVTSSTGSTFTLKPFRTGTELTVDIASAPTVSISAGQMVDVKIDPGTIDPAAFTPATPITAKSVTVEKQLMPAEKDDVFAEGFFSAPTGTAAANTFDMNGMTVDTGSFVMPSADTRVMVHGKFANGVLTADRIELSGISNFFIGALGSVGTGTMSFGTGTSANMFEIGNATILVNGKAGHANDLQAGKQVIVQSAATLSTMGTGTSGMMESAATSPTGTASQVWVVDNLTGPISEATGSISSGPTGSLATGTTGTIRIFGQTIRIDDKTRIGHNLVSSTTGSVMNLAAGSVINVSGIPDGTGSMLATFIDSKPTATQFHVLGLASAVTGSSFRLTPVVNGTPLEVTLASAVTTTVGEGQLVDINVDPGTFSEFALPVLTAASADIVNQPAPADGDQVTVEGVVYNASGNTFTVNGINVDASGVSGGMPSGLANGSKVRVRGVMSGTTLRAETIEIIS